MPGHGAHRPSSATITQGWDTHSHHHPAHSNPQYIISAGRTRFLHIPIETGLCNTAWGQAPGSAVKLPLSHSHPMQVQARLLAAQLPSVMCPQWLEQLGALTWAPRFGLETFAFGSEPTDEDLSAFPKVLGRDQAGAREVGSGASLERGSFSPLQDRGSRQVLPWLQAGGARLRWTTGCVMRCDVTAPLGKQTRVAVLSLALCIRVLFPTEHSCCGQPHGSPELAHPPRAAGGQSACQHQQGYYLSHLREDQA